MSFPFSPTNNQTAIINGITFSYSSANNAWSRISAGNMPAILIGANTTIATGNIYIGDPTTFTSNVSLNANTSIATGNVWLSDVTTFTRTVDVASPRTGATGTVTYDMNVSNVFYETSPAANWTANYINLPSALNRVVVMTHIINQGSSAYVPTAVQINGSAQTVKWVGGTALTSGDANAIDIVAFSIMQVSSGTYIVMGQYTKYS